MCEPRDLYSLSCVAENERNTGTQYNSALKAKGIGKMFMVMQLVIFQS